jgi:hypothetical protein
MKCAALGDGPCRSVDPENKASSEIRLRLRQMWSHSNCINDHCDDSMKVWQWMIRRTNFTSDLVNSRKNNSLWYRITDVSRANSTLVLTWQRHCNYQLIGRYVWIKLTDVSGTISVPIISSQPTQWRFHYFQMPWRLHADLTSATLQGIKQPGDPRKEKWSLLRIARLLFLDIGTTKR